MTAREWIDSFAAAIGAEPPDDATVTQLLDLAGVAAHSSQRIAAPVACWLAAKAGVGLEEAIRLAQDVDPGPADVDPGPADV